MFVTCRREPARPSQTRNEAASASRPRTASSRHKTLRGSLLDRSRQRRKRHPPPCRYRRTNSWPPTRLDAEQTASLAPRNRSARPRPLPLCRARFLPYLAPALADGPPRTAPPAARFCARPSVWCSSGRRGRPRSLRALARCSRDRSLARGEGAAEGPACRQEEMQEEQSLGNTDRDKRLTHWLDGQCLARDLGGLYCQCIGSFTRTNGGQAIGSFSSCRGSYVVQE